MNGCSSTSNRNTESIYGLRLMIGGLTHLLDHLLANRKSKISIINPTRGQNANTRNSFALLPAAGAVVWSVLLLGNNHPPPACVGSHPSARGNDPWRNHSGHFGSRLGGVYPGSAIVGENCTFSLCNFVFAVHHLPGSSIWQFHVRPVDCNPRFRVRLLLQSGPAGKGIFYTHWLHAGDS